MATTLPAPLPDCDNLLLERADSVLRITLNRPDVRNALSPEMVSELSAVIDGVRQDRTVRALVIRGAGGTFCAGGDIKGFKAVFQGGDLDPAEVAANNRAFGTFMIKLNEAPQAVVMAVEGAAMGGGMGLICVSDVAIAVASTKLSLTETSLGLPPAQIAPFVAQRIGLTAARRLMVTGARFDGAEAARLGLVHQIVEDSAALDAAIAKVLGSIDRCAPGANGATKDILFSAIRRPLEDTLDFAADRFAECMLGEEGREGVGAFLEKRKPSWVEQGD